MMDPKMRSLGSFDLEILAELHRLCFTAPWDQSWSTGSFAEILAMPGAAGWLISDQDAAALHQPRGFILVRSVLDEMEIILVGTDPQYRQRGLGGRLVDQAIDFARQTGIKHVFLEHAAPNLAARALYRSRGFAEIGSRPGYYRGPAGESIDARVLRLIIA